MVLASGQLPALLCLDKRASDEFGIFPRAAKAADKDFRGKPGGAGFFAVENKNQQCWPSEVAAMYKRYPFFPASARVETVVRPRTWRRAVIRLIQACAALLLLSRPAWADPSKYFAIEVIDANTGRGVPLVELRTNNDIRFYTDSAGLVAFNEPGLMDRDVFFFISSQGYEFPADGFGMRGKALYTPPGGSARIEIKRINIAERLYRITGQGIYRDTVLLGRKAPIDEPVLNGRVLGQDSTLNAIYQGTLYWFLGRHKP
jgi:hypothetical protein